MAVQYSPDPTTFPKTSPPADKLSVDDLFLRIEGTCSAVSLYFETSEVPARVSTRAREIATGFGAGRVFVTFRVEDLISAGNRALEKPPADRCTEAQTRDTVALVVNTGKLLKTTAEAAIRLEAALPR